MIIEQIIIEMTLKDHLVIRLNQMATAHGRPPVEIVADIIERGILGMPSDLGLMFEAALVILNRHKLVIQWSNEFARRSDAARKSSNKSI